MKARGEITVFLSMCMLCVSALLCVLIESARTAGSRFYFQVAVNGSLDTLFSQYHRRLWTQYRILGMEYETEPEVQKRLESYIEKYLEAEDWYPMELETVEIQECATLADQCGDYLVQEIMDYMKFGIWDNLELVPEEGERLWKDVCEAEGAGTINLSYDGQEREVQKLEQAVEAIISCVEKQEMLARQVREALIQENLEDFHACARSFYREEKRMDGLIETYKRRSDALKNALSKSESCFKELNTEFRKDRRELLKEQMTPYYSYIAEDGKRKQEILRQQEIGRQNAQLLQETETLIERLVEEFREREQEEDEDDEEELSLAPAVSLWEGFQATRLRLERGTGDTQKRGFLERARDLAQGSLLKLVLPEGMEVSKGVLPAPNLSSVHPSEKSQMERNPIQQILLHEYCENYFLNAISQEKRPVQYEMEYLLQGKENDQKNLEGVIRQIFLVRQGLNLIHILSDSEKREEARTLAAVITGVTGIAPLTEITACFIMVVWAMGEAVVDIKTLLKGGNVPLWKRNDEWKLSIDGLLSLGQGGICPEADQEGSGLSYGGYLKLLLMTVNQASKQQRILDIIQMNIQREEPEFSLDYCACQMDIRGKASGKHVFFSLPIVEIFVSGEKGYPLEAKAQKLY